METIRKKVTEIVAKKVGWPPDQLCDDQMITPEAWYRLALLCHVYLAEGFIFWRRPDAPRRLGDIVETIFHHNAAHAA